MKHAVGHAITGMTYSVRQSFERSLTTLQAVTPKVIETCQLDVLVPSRPAYSEKPLSVSLDARRRAVLDAGGPAGEATQEVPPAVVAPGEGPVAPEATLDVDADGPRPRMMSAV